MIRLGSGSRDEGSKVTCAEGVGGSKLLGKAYAGFGGNRAMFCGVNEPWRRPLSQ